MEWKLKEKHSPGLLSGLATFANTLPERKRHAAGLLAKFNNPTTAAAAEETKAFLKKVLVINIFPKGIIFYGICSYL